MDYMIDEQTIKKGAAKTKIVWTLGPESRSVVMIEKLLEAGMNIARFDFSEGSHAYHQETHINLRTAVRNTGILCAVMLDLKGPEMIPTGEGEVVNLPTLTQKDKDDILQWGIPNRINIIVLPSVRKGSDLDHVRESLGKRGENIMLMSKIDNEEAAGNVDEIMEQTDAIVLSRGSPGVDQKKMIEKANALGKPVVTAIQILGGQTTTTDDDLANAVLDFTTDCVMLLPADEAHPDTALQRISSLCKELEKSIDYKAVRQKIRKALPTPLLPMARKAAYASWKYPKAKAIITVDKSAAKLVARCRPSIPILLVVTTVGWSSHEASFGLVSRGIIPLFGAGSRSIRIGDMISFAVQVAKKEGICNAGDSVVALRILNGWPAVFPLRVQ
ncbi:hypothetical protein HA466_0314430 [Hirschfeldia incana]|nr:hypothetical protein HA466_0314430 [Hirschfeldia incana]